MKHTLKNQAMRANILFVAVAALAVFGIGTGFAAPQPDSPTFTSASIDIETRGEEVGGLNCRWRETGLGDSQVVYYTCGAAAVGALKACVYKNRVIYNSPTRLDTFKNVYGEAEEGGGEVPFLSQKNGQINAAATTPIPEIEQPEGAEMCLEPTAEEVVAVRWCGASLTDKTNDLVGTTATELFEEFYPGVGTVPSCTELQATP